MNGRRFIAVSQSAGAGQDGGARRFPPPVD